MSAAAHAPAPAARPAVKERPALRLVRPVRRAPRLPFVLVVVGLLAVGLVGLLLLSMQRAQASIALAGLQRGTDTGTEQVQALRAQVQADHDPAVLASRAAALGMVPGVMAGYLGPNGSVLGPVPSGAPRPGSSARAVDGVVVAGTAKPPVAQAKPTVSATVTSPASTVRTTPTAHGSPTTAAVRTAPTAQATSPAVHR